MNRRVILPIVVVCLTTLLSFSRTAPGDQAEPKKQAENSLPNPSFEEAVAGKPAGWSTQTWGGKATFLYADTGRAGGRSVMIASDGGADVSWTVTVPVDPAAQYRLSGWIKTEEVKALATGGRRARGALLNLHNMQGIATGAVTGTSDWTKVQVVFDAGGNAELQVNCLFGGWGLATGKAWFDDVKLEKLSMKDWKPAITIDTKKTGEPISKYIYGQFIEHLGRCIYGGIWAEMLQDRKFFIPVGGKSPWKPVGQRTVVTMDKQDSFVGDHTPRITLPGDGKPGGIVQGGLGLIKAKQYVGRIWLAGHPEAAPVKVSLAWGDAENDRQTVTVDKLGKGYAKTPLEFTAGADTDNGRLEITAAGKGGFLVGTASLMPADNVQGMRADTMALLKELDSPVYRWPGGNFVSGYNWKDGIGDRDRRPPRNNPAWKGIEHNDFGIDEFVVFCRLLNTDPFITVNSGLGDAKMAVEELQYANGGPGTEMGKLRAKNGHPEPYKVKWWAIGNEMYGGWQLGHMPLEKYVQKHNQFADDMRAVDPSIKLIAVGATGRWSEGMMQHCADHMDLVSEHFYVRGRPGLVSHVQQVPAQIRAKAETHRRYRRQFDSLKGKDIDVALDEWNYWYGPHLYGELGVRYFLKDALGVAAGLNEYARQSDIMFMANYAQTVNVIGCIKTSNTAAAFATTGLALKLYRRHFGVVPVSVTAEQPLDVAAALSQDRKTLTVAIVNPTMNKLDIPLDVKGAKLAGTGKRWQIAGDDPMAYNEPGKPPQVTIEEAPVSEISDRLSVAPCSVTLYALAVE